MADALLLLALVAVPLVVGAAVGYTQKPWWWAAAASVVVFVVAVLAPTPEEGESRVAAGDLGFLAVASLVVAALAWVGAALGRRLARRRGAVR